MSRRARALHSRRGHILGRRLLTNWSVIRYAGSIDELAHSLTLTG